MEKGYQKQFSGVEQGESMEDFCKGLQDMMEGLEGLEKGGKRESEL